MLIQINGLKSYSNLRKLEKSSNSLSFPGSYSSVSDCLSFKLLLLSVDGVLSGHSLVDMLMATASTNSLHFSSLLDFLSAHAFLYAGSVGGWTTSVGWYSQSLNSSESVDRSSGYLDINLWTEKAMYVTFH